MGKILVQIVLAAAACAGAAQAQDLPTGNPQDFKVKTCLHSVSYSGVWRGQTVLTLDQFLVKAHELGFDGVEIMCKRPHLSPVDYDDAARHKLRARLEELHLKLVALAAYTDFSAGMDKPGVPQAEIQAVYLGEVARLAKDLGTNLVRVFTGYDREGISYDQQYNAVVQGLRLGGQQAARYGVTLAVQNHDDLAITADGMSWLLKEVNLPNVLAAWDAWSPSAQGYTPAEIRQGVLKLKPYIVHTTAAQYLTVHRYHLLSDVVNYERIPSVNVEIPMGPGMVDYDNFFNALREIGYQGYVAYEICAVTEGGGSIENLDRVARSFLEYMKKFR